MPEEQSKSIQELFEEGTAIDAALKKAVRDELLRHKKRGNSIVVWKDSRVVWLSPEEIELDDPAEDLRTGSP